MRRQLVCTIAISGLLAGCAGNPPPPPRLDDKISATLNEAVSAKVKPSQAEIARMQEALLPPLRIEIPAGPGRPVEPRFDLIVSNAPAQQVFTSIVSGTRYSMLIHPDVSGSISVSLKDVTVQEALDSIRQVYGYEYTIEGTRIHILPAGLQTRVFQVNYLIGARQGRSDMRVSTRMSNSTGTGGTGTAGGTAGAAAASVVQTQAPSLTPNGAGALDRISSDASQMATIQLTDFWAELSASLRAMIGGAQGRNVIISPQAGIVAVRAMPQELRSVEAFLKAMQLSVDRQVMLEAKIIDVTLLDSYQAGVNWAAFPTSGIAAGFTSSGSISTTGAMAGSSVTADPSGRVLGALGAGAAAAANPAAGVLGLALQTSNFAALLQFLESQGNVQVLSSPRVATLNNQKAVIKVGVDEPFVLSNSNSQQSGAATNISAQTNVSTVFSGISLDILPQIDESGNITLHVHPVVSQVTRRLVDVPNSPTITTTGAISQGGNSKMEVPQVSISESDTVVRTTGGNIVALGGLMRVEVNDDRGGVPGLSEAPGIGGAFRNTAKKTVKRELIILIKPTIIPSDGDNLNEIRQARDRINDMIPPSAGGQR